MPDHPGQPTQYNKDFHPQEFIRHSKDGKNLTQIASLWDLSRETLYEWQRIHPEFSDAAVRGRMHMEAWYASLGQMGMVGQIKINGKDAELNWTGFKWMTQNVCKWRHNVSQELAGVDGKPIEYKNLTEKELRERAAAIANEVTREAVVPTDGAGENTERTGGETPS